MGTVVNISITEAPDNPQQPGASSGLVVSDTEPVSGVDNQLWLMPRERTIALFRYQAGAWALLLEWPRFVVA